MKSARTHWRTAFSGALQGSLILVVLAGCLESDSPENPAVSISNASQIYEKARDEARTWHSDSELISIFAAEPGRVAPTLADEENDSFGLLYRKIDSDVGDGRTHTFLFVFHSNRSAQILATYYAATGEHLLREEGPAGAQHHNPLWSAYPLTDWRYSLEQAAQALLGLSEWAMCVALPEVSISWRLWDAGTGPRWSGELFLNNSAGSWAVDAQTGKVIGRELSYGCIPSAPEGGRFGGDLDLTSRENQAWWNLTGTEHRTLAFRLRVFGSQIDRAGVFEIFPPVGEKMVGEFSGGWTCKGGSRCTFREVHLEPPEGQYRAVFRLDQGVNTSYDVSWCAGADRSMTFESGHPCREAFEK